MFRKYDNYLFLLILVLTVCLAWGFELTKTNFSRIANQEGKRWLLWCWGAVVGNSTYLYMGRMMELARCKDGFVRIFMTASLFLLIIGVGIPYCPELLPKLAGFHVVVSFLATVCFGMAQSRFLYVLQKKEGKIWRNQWFVQGILIAISVGCLIYYRMVTSLLEIFLTVGLCSYLFKLYRKLEKVF